MGLIRSIDALRPALRGRARVFEHCMEEAGIAGGFNETGRDPLVQKAYYLQGREPLEVVNQARLEAGIWPLTPEENRRRITDTLQSAHLEGRAFDWCPYRDPVKKYFDWNPPRKVIDIMAAVGKELGLTWGGDFKRIDGTPFFDWPHFEISREEANA